MRHVAYALCMAMICAAPLRADPVIDALQSAIEAYEDGDMQYALDEIAEAQRLIGAKKTAGLAEFLPEAPAGWTREVSAEANAALIFLGGGVLAEATYTRDGEQFTLKLMADNPMVAQMGAMLGNQAMIAQMGKVRRIKRVRFLEQDQSLQALVGNRVLVQAEGAAPDVMEPVVAAIDFGALEKFGN